LDSVQTLSPRHVTQSRASSAGAFSLSSPPGQVRVPFTFRRAGYRLTRHRLGFFQALGVSPKTTNCLASLAAQLGQVTDAVDRWRTSDLKQRWVASALLTIEPRGGGSQATAPVAAPHGTPGRDPLCRAHGAHTCCVRP
jgi:hypothetical protein